MEIVATEGGILALNSACSAEGLPYLGRTKKWSNLIMATGHSMVGMSLGAGTGKLVAEIIDEKPTSIDISFYDPERYDR